MKLLWVWLALAACGDDGMSPPPCVGADCPCVAEAALQCDGTCIDAANDPTNCGGCGHDCLGGACEAGACLPQVLTTVPGSPAAMIATDDDLVFATHAPITSSGIVYRVPKTGGAPTVIYRGLGAEASLAAEGDRILVADSGMADRCSPYRGGGSILSIGSIDDVTLRSRGRRCPRYMIPDAAGLVWADDAPSTLFVTSDPLPWLAFLPAGSAADVAPTQLAARSYIRDLTLAGDQLVWTSGQTVQRMARAGGPVFSVVGADHFAVSGDRLAYVANRRVVLRSLATGSEAGIAADVETVRTMAVDASFVYWITGDELWAADPATLTSRQIATVAIGYLPVDQAIAQDDLFLYVLQKTSRDTNIVRIRKPASTRPFPASFTCRAQTSTCSDDPFVTGPCFDLSNDPYNCGACGTMCTTGEVCTNGACSCGTAALVCGGTCVDPTTDANNCGTCGRSCGTGACVGGDCAPVMVMSGFVGTPVDDASAVYFAQGHDVKRYDKQTSQVTLLRTVMYARDLAIDATRLYMIETAGTIGSTNPGTIHALSKDGQTFQPLFTGRPDPRDLAVVGNKVVWIEDASDASETPATIATGAITGAGSPQLVTVLGLYTGAADDRSVGFAVAGTSAYWLLGDPSSMRSAIARVDFSTSPATVSLVTEMTSGYPRAIAVVGTQLYVTLSSSTDPVMLSVPITGGVATLVTRTGEDVQSLATTTNGGLMWLEANRSPASIRLLAAGALTPRTVALEYRGPTAILPEGDRFFIATEDGLMLVR